MAADTSQQLELVTLMDDVDERQPLCVAMTGVHDIAGAMTIFTEFLGVK